MYCHIHHCHYHHCHCVPKDSKEKGGALTQEELLAYTQEMKEELKDYTVDLKDQIFSYIDIGVNPVEIANTFESLKEQDTYILRTLTNTIDELNNTTNLSMFNLRTRVTNLEGQSATLIQDLADRTERIEELESGFSSLPVVDGLVPDTYVTKTVNGEGQVERTQSEKNSDFISVKDFGAVGDGETLDHLAIQAGIDYCSSNGKTLFIPDGVYLVDVTYNKHASDKRWHAIILRDNSQIVLSNNAVIKVQPNNAKGYSIFRGPGVTNIHIKGGILQGDKLDHSYSPDETHEWGHGLMFEGVVSNVTLEDIYIKDFMGDCIHFTSSAPYANLVIKGCRLEDARRHELTLGFVNGVRVVNTTLIKNEEFNRDNPLFNKIHTPYGGINCDVEPNGAGVVKDIHFIGCKFVSTANVALAIDMRHSTFENVVIRDNDITTNSSAIKLNAGSGVTVENNRLRRISNSGSPDHIGISLAGIVDSKIVSNTVENFSLNIRLTDTDRIGEDTLHCSNLLIAFNNLLKCRALNLSVGSNSKLITIKNNIFGASVNDSAGNYALNMRESSSITIKDNIFKAPEEGEYEYKSSIILHSCTDSVIVSNLFNNPGQKTIQLRGAGTTNIDLVGNIFKADKVADSYSISVLENVLGNVTISNNVSINPLESVNYSYIFELTNTNSQRTSPIIIANNTTVGKFRRVAKGAQEVDRIYGNSLGSEDFDSSFKAMNFTSKPSSSLVTVGYSFFATDLGKVVYFNGTSWVDSTGVEIEGEENE